LHIQLGHLHKQRRDDEQRTGLASSSGQQH
jgi:hypothetical protein